MHKLLLLWLWLLQLCQLFGVLYCLVPACQPVGLHQAASQQCCHGDGVAPGGRGAAQANTAHKSSAGRAPAVVACALSCCCRCSLPGGVLHICLTNAKGSAALAWAAGTAARGCGPCDARWPQHCAPPGKLQRQQQHHSSSSASTTLVCFVGLSCNPLARLPPFAMTTLLTCCICSYLFCPVDSWLGGFVGCKGLCASINQSMLHL
jgi:hypothetical protein